ncbi:MAG TPA: histidine phosphatase family protein [Caulobacteraceae bacterium]|jgi:probable phosphoglycerate mutase|nr:histidine phosphatase family protein [Caulobacteraceae bacterium]
MIWLVRHGQTEMNVEGRFNGRIDSALTARGEAQARRLGERLRELAADIGGDWAIVPSPAGRARRTAELIAETSGLALGAGDERLAEWDFGPWEGLTREEIVALRPDLADVRAFFLRNSDAESYERLSGRVRSWMDEALASAQHHVAVSHAGAGRIMRGLHLGLSVDALRELETAQGVIYRFLEGRIERFECPELPSAAAAR